MAIPFFVLLYRTYEDGCSSSESMSFKGKAISTLHVLKYCRTGPVLCSILVRSYTTARPSSHTMVIEVGSLSDGCQRYVFLLLETWSQRTPLWPIE